MVPLMDWVQLGFSWFLFVASLVAWVATTGKSGEMLPFWLIMAVAWACFGTAEILLVSETWLADDWMTIALRITGYVALCAAVINSIWELSEERFM